MGIIDVCNRALSEIGTQKTIQSLDDATPAATQCKLWYDNQRQGLLRAAPWGFARRQLALTLLGKQSDATSPFPWIFKYAYPADCLKMRYVLQTPFNFVAPPQVWVGEPGPVWWRPSRTNRYIVAMDQDPDTGAQQKVILSNVCAAIGVYTTDLTDPDLFDPLFETALTNALAYKLVIPLSGNAGMREQFRVSAEGSVQNARVADANEAIPTSDHVADWIAARGIGTLGGNDAGSDCAWGEWNCTWDNMNWGM